MSKFYWKVGVWALLPVLCLQLWAQDYQCHFNLAPVGKTLTEAETSKWIKTFTFNPQKDDVGRSFSFQGVELVLAKRQGLIQLRLRHEAQKVQVSTAFSLEQSEFYLRTSGDIEVRCLTQKSLEQGKGTALEQQLHQKLSEASDLGQWGNRLDVVIENTLTFKYAQKNAVGEMRPIVFAEGKLLTLDDILPSGDSMPDVCYFNVKLQLQEDTIMQKGKSFTPVSFEVHSNNQTRSVHSYNFVDFESGKTTVETKRYIPFSLECNLKRGEIFTPAHLKRITGGRLSLRQRDMQ